MKKNSYQKFTLKSVEQYYQNKLLEHGVTQKGVDWPTKESQYLRFEQLCKIITKTDEQFSITDLGCGYGELIRYLDSKYDSYDYRGYDVSEKMIDSAKTLMKADSRESRVKFLQGSEIVSSTDYVVASGVFNVKLESSDDDWLEYIIKTITNMNQSADKGFSFNCLTKYSDNEKMQDYLYYSEPNFIFDYCKKNFSRNVALLHDYDLYEFTILVRK